MAKDWSSGKLGGKPCSAWTTPGNKNGQSGEQIFDAVWNRFLNDSYNGKRATVGTIYFDAKAAGWSYHTTSTKTPSDQGQGQFEEGAGSTSEQLTPLQKVQLKHCLVLIDGKVWHLDQHSHNTITLGEPAKKLILSNRGDGALLVTRSLRVLVGQDEAGKLAKEFFNDPETVCYDGERFMQWRTIDGVTLDPLGEFNELETLIRGVLATKFERDKSILTLAAGGSGQQTNDKAK